MPELPEVETVRTGLAQAITGSRMTQVTLRREGLRVPFPPDLAQMLTGRTIRGITRRAKYLLFSFDSEAVLLAHLGMSGNFRVDAKAPKQYGTHDHAVFHLHDGRVLIYNDPRRFGVITLTDSANQHAHPMLAHLGPEPLEEGFTPAYLRTALAARSGAIKPTLMDQQLVVGVGNIYASEALFHARISPLHPAREVAGKAPAMVTAIQAVLRDAIASGGSSLRDFLHVSGEAGYFQHHFHVYDREGEPCSRCKTPISALTQAGRSTYFCSKCQK
jgi:formamidopyrimidine-DNA glycosylase